tara:strand:- start:49 stop:309 length:261 start_codon:yes stop_codon:yes gene_type:complete
MNINQLISIVKKKLEKDINIEKIKVEDKSFLHKGHAGNKLGKFHLKISIQSKDLKKMDRIKSNKKIYSILSLEMREFIHSLQILIK